MSVRQVIQFGCVSLGLLAGLTGASSLHAQAAQGTLTVATREAPPFSMQDEAGRWVGISIDLWKDIALEAGWAFEFREMSLQDILESVAVGAVDAGVAALTVTAERETALDFTQPFFTSGLSIAVGGGRRGIASRLIGSLLSRQFLQVLGALMLVLLIPGALVWFFERKRNAQFGGKGYRGVLEGFWWSAVTMTTVGYGDKSPQTGPGRFVALVWMFTSVIIISAFTAGIATALTVGELDVVIEGPEDLPGRLVGTVTGSASEEYLRERGHSVRAFDSVHDALAALAVQNVEAVVYDEPLLRYLANGEFQGTVRILPVEFGREDYAIALPPGSPLRESINRSLLSMIEDPRWSRVVNLYLGAN